MTSIAERRGLWVACARCGARARYPVWPAYEVNYDWFRKTYRGRRGVSIKATADGPIFECREHGELADRWDEVRDAMLLLRTLPATFPPKRITVRLMPR